MSCWSSSHKEEDNKGARAFKHAPPCCLPSKIHLRNFQRASTNTKVGEAKLTQIAWIVNIATIKDDGVIEQRLDALEEAAADYQAPRQKFVTVEEMLEALDSEEGSKQK